MVLAVDHDTAGRRVEIKARIVMPQIAERRFGSVL